MELRQVIEKAQHELAELPAARPPAPARPAPERVNGDDTPPPHALDRALKQYPDGKLPPGRTVSGF